MSSRSRLLPSLSLVFALALPFGVPSLAMADTPSDTVSAIQANTPTDQAVQAQTGGADVSSAVSPVSPGAQTPSAVTGNTAPETSSVQQVDVVDHDYSVQLFNIQMLLYGILAVCALVSGSMVLHFFWRAMSNA